MWEQYFQPLSSSALYLHVRRRGNGWHYAKDNDGVLKCPGFKRGSPHATPAPPAAIFLPFPKRNVISAEIKTKAPNKTLLRQFSAIYLSGWAFKDARLIRLHGRQQLTFTDTNKLQTDTPAEGIKTSIQIQSQTPSRRFMYRSITRGEDGRFFWGKCVCVVLFRR